MRRPASAADWLLAGAAEVAGGHGLVGELPAAPRNSCASRSTGSVKKAGSAVIVVGWSEDGKVGLIAAVTDDLVKKGLKAGSLVGEAAKWSAARAAAGHPWPRRAARSRPSFRGVATGQEAGQRTAGRELTPLRMNGPFSRSKARVGLPAPTLPKTNPVAL